MPVAELATLEEDDAVKSLIDFFRKPNGLGNPAQAAKIAKSLRWTAALSEAVPILVSLGRMGIADGEDLRLSRERQRRKEQLMLDGPGAPWRAAVTSVREGLRAATPSAQEITDIEARRDEVSAARKTLLAGG